jgi:hypothetical protein
MPEHFTRNTLYEEAVRRGKVCIDCKREFCWYDTKIYISAGVNVHPECAGHFARKLFKKLDSMGIDPLKDL